MLFNLPGLPQGNARLLNSDTGDSLIQTTHTTDHQYLVALVILFVSFALFEVPSNYMLKKFRPSRWIAFLMLGWGVTTMTLGAVNNYSGVLAVRFLLGMFEAGLFPGLVYCLTLWYKPEERAVRIAFLVACATLGGAFGGAIAFAIGHMNGVLGLQAWKWLFIIEGAPSVAAAFLTFFHFPDFPETAKWLSPDERELSVERLQGVASLGHHQITWSETIDTLVDWRLYLHYAAFIAICVPFASISLFSPTIVAGLGYEGLDAQLFTVPPYAMAFVVTNINAYLSDRYEKRAWGASSALFIAGVSFLVQGKFASISLQRILDPEYMNNLQEHSLPMLSKPAMAFFVSPSLSHSPVSLPYSAGSPPTCVTPERLRWLFL